MFTSRPRKAVSSLRTSAYQSSSKCRHRESPSSDARCGRAHDIGEHHGGEHAIGLRATGAAPVMNSSIIVGDDVLRLNVYE